jgi:hypothetical protein
MIIIMGEIYKLDGRITDIETRMKNIENKLNYILETLNNNNIKEYETTTRLD